VHCVSSTRVRLCFYPAGSPGGRAWTIRDGRGWGEDREPTDEPVELVERVAALDLGKAAVVACVRVPHEDRPDRRRQEIREYSTLSRSLLELADWLRCERIELVAMEATSDYWKPVFYLLEAEGFTCWLLNAKHVENVPGRPKRTSSTLYG
jgi:transposase